jgi:hypothetical protein
MDIDFVILWVDGAESEHRKKREYWLDQENGIYDYDPEQSVSDSRFIQHDELKYCLRSIKQHAPWYRKIWLVTDNQIPSFLDPELLVQDRIEVVDHTVIFKDYEHYLPTFNTRAIATMVHRIPGLSECFVFSNDDVMIGSHVDKSFFFENKKPIILGDWHSVQRDEIVRLHKMGVINGAILEHFSDKRFLNTSHVFYPMLKSQILRLKDKHETSFENNIRHKFRDVSQFVFESLFNHSCLNDFDSTPIGTELVVHFSNELCRIGKLEKIEFLLDLIKKKNRKIFCVNDAGTLFQRSLKIQLVIDNICGEKLICEKSGSQC